MNKTVGVLVVILLVGAGIGYYMMQETTTEVKKAAVMVKPAPITPAKSQPAQESAVPLPELKDSDQAMIEALSELLGAEVFNKYFRPGEIVRHIVVTIDNLPRKTAAARLFPIRPVGGKFRTRGDEDHLVISSRNAARYTPYVSVVEAIDAKKLVAIYARFSPLFKRAYEELGYPSSSFNDRLITVVDHLIDAPDIKGQVKLVQPNVLFLYADPNLEEQSAGRKIMMRMGSENEARIKNKLREIRGELARQFSKQLSGR